MNSVSNSEFNSSVVAIKGCLCDEVKFANAPALKEFAEKIKPVVEKSLNFLNKAHEAACKNLSKESRYEVEIKRCEINAVAAFEYLKEKFSEVELIDKEIQKIAQDLTKQRTSNKSLTGNLNRYRKLAKTEPQAAEGMLNNRNLPAAEKNQMNALKGHLIKLDQLEKLQEKSRKVAEKVEEEFQAIVEKKPKESPKSWVRLGYEGLPLKRDPINDTGGFARDYSESTNYVQMGHAHMSGRLAIFKLTAKACGEVGDELKWHNRIIGDQCMAHSQIRCVPAKKCVGHENAHISLLPQVALKNKDGSNVRPGEWCELDSPVSMSILNPKCTAVQPLSYILNCTDYMPKEFNQIDDYCETELRGGAIDLLNAVVSKKINIDTASLKLSVGFQKSLTNLKTDLAATEEPSHTKGSRFPELYRAYKNATRKPKIDDAIAGMQTAAGEYAKSK